MRILIRSVSTTVKVLRGLAALGVLTAIVVGVPWFLSAALGWLWPRPVPTSFDEVEPWLAVWRIDRGRFVLDLLGIVGWAYWAAFVRQLVVQLPGAIADAAAVARKRVPHGAVRRAGPAASVVGLLLAMTVLSVASARSSAAAATGPRFVVPQPSASAAVASPTHGHGYVVQRGDDLWDIAADHLGDPRRWTEIYADNRGRPQPDGAKLEDPDLIQPGWRLNLPASVAVPAPMPSPPVAPTAPATQSRQTAADQAVAAPAARSAIPQRDRAGVQLPSGGYVGVGLASAFAASLALARLLRRSRTTARWPIPTPNKRHPTFRDATVVALERAHLATLAPPCLGYVQQGDIAEPDDLNPYLLANDPGHAAGDPGAPPVPARSGLSGPTIPASIGSLNVPAGLALGIDEDQAAVLLDFRSTPGVRLIGDGAADAARALLIAAVTSGGPLTNLDQLRVLVPAEDFTMLFQCETPGLPRLDLVPGLDAAIDLLETEYLRRRRVLADREVRNAAELRRFYPDQAFEPVLLIARCADSGEPRLSALLDVGRNADLHALLLGSWDSGTSVQIDAFGRTTCEDVRYHDLDAFRLGIPEASALLTELGAPTSLDEDIAEPPAVPEPRSASVSSVTPVDPLPPDRPRVQINILGPVTITVDGREVTTYNKVRTVLAYLALHSSGASSERLLEDIWISDAGEVTGKPATVRATIYNARTELRNASDQPDRAFIDNRNGRYILLPEEVGTDISAFHHHLNTANRASAEADQISALQLAVDCYRGQLANDLHADWLIVEREAESRRFGDACCRLSDLTLESRPELALQVLERALADAQFNQELYAKIMRVQARLGRYSELTKTVRLLELRMAALDDEPDESIYELLRELVDR